jgi:hypothetical protein
VGFIGDSGLRCAGQTTPAPGLFMVGGSFSEGERKRSFLKKRTKKLLSLAYERQA